MMDKLLEKVIIEARKSPNAFSSERFSILLDNLVKRRGKNENSKET